MEAQEFKEKLNSLDRSMADVRAERLRDLTPETIKANLPHLVWRYLTEAENMYIYGYFIGVIMVCAATMELTLADQISAEMHIDDRDISHFELQQVVILGRSLGMISAGESDELEKYRLIRNSLIHGNSGKLNQMARRLYESNGFSTAQPLETYLSPTSGNGINHDAVNFLRLTRIILLRFYGEKLPVGDFSADAHQE